MRRRSISSGPRRRWLSSRCSQRPARRAVAPRPRRKPGLQGVDSFGKLPLSGPAAGDAPQLAVRVEGDIFCFSLAGCCGEGCDLRPEFRGAASNPCGLSEGLRSSLLDGGSQQPQCVSVGLSCLHPPLQPSSSKIWWWDFKETPQNPHVTALFYLDLFLPSIHSTCSILDSSALLQLALAVRRRPGCGEHPPVPLPGWL